MKKTVILLLLAILASPLVAQQDRSSIKAKLARYSKMKKNGTRLAAAGVGLTLAGIWMTAASGYDPLYNGYPFGIGVSLPDKPLETAGVISLLSGVGMMGSGVPLGIIGSVKSRRYEERLKTISLNMRISQQRAAVGLTFTF